MKNTILITGASGNTGFELVKILKEKNANFKIGGRNVEKLKNTFGENIETIRFDFTDKSTYKNALRDTEKIFLVRPPALSNVKKEIAPFIKASKEKGIKQIVFLSLYGADKNKITPHYKIQKEIENINIPYTFLKPTFFMQNFTETHKNEIRDNNEIFIPAGNKKTNFIHTKDIASIAAIVLLEEGHEYKSYDIAGRDTLSYYEIANIFSEILQRKINYKKPNPLSFIIRKVKEGNPLPFVLIMTALYSLIKEKRGKSYSNDAEKILKRPTISFKDYVLENKEIWQ